MPLELGGAFPPRARPLPPEPQPPTVEDLRTEQMLSALAGLREALAAMPAPVVNVAEPDLTAIVQAVTQIKGPATPGEIAQAVKLAIAPESERTAMEPVLAEMVDALKTLDFRLKGVGSGGGGGVGSRVQNIDGTSLDTREAQSDVRYEWQNVAGTSVPLYSGSAAPGTATTAAAWRIEKYGYITGPAGDAVPAVIQSAAGAWDSRASLF